MISLSLYHSSHIDDDKNSKYFLNHHTSPFPSIPPAPYEPLPEFISKEWATPSLSSKVAIIDGSTQESRTFLEYKNIMTNLAASLHETLDVKEDKTVALYCPNHVDYVPIVLAINMAGGKVIPINPVYTWHELEKIMKKGNVDVIISHESIVNNIFDLLAKRNNGWNKDVPVVVIPEVDGGSVPEGTVSLSDLKKHNKPFVNSIPCSHGNTSSHTAVLPFSSGTTGLPKGVCCK